MIRDAMLFDAWRGVRSNPIADVVPSSTIGKCLWHSYQEAYVWSLAARGWKQPVCHETLCQAIAEALTGRCNLDKDLATEVAEGLVSAFETFGLYE